MNLKWPPEEERKRREEKLEGRLVRWKKEICEKLLCLLEGHQTGGEKIWNRTSSLWVFHTCLWESRWSWGGSTVERGKGRGGGEKIQFLSTLRLTHPQRMNSQPQLLPLPQIQK